MLTIARHPAHTVAQKLWSSRLAALAAFLCLALLLATLPVEWIVVGVAAITGAIFALVYPLVGWLLLAFSLPVASGIRVGPALLTDALFALAVALTLAATIRHRRHFIAPRLPVWPIGLYVLVLYLSSIGATDLGEALTEMVKWIEFGLLLLLLPMALPARWVPWLVAALLSAAALQGLLGLYQFVFRIGPDWFLIQGRFMRASGVFGQPNPFGAYMGLSLPVAVSLALWAALQTVRQRSLSVTLCLLLATLAAACIAAGLLASWSRGAWLGVIGALAVVLWLLERRTALLLAAGALALAIMLLLGAVNPAWIPPAIASRLGDIPAYFGLVDVLTLEVNDDNFAVIERVAHWVAALRMWEVAPWLGVGPGNYAVEYPSYALPRWPDPLGHAHNIYLNTLGESGVLGLTAFLLLWLSLVLWLFRKLRTALPTGSWQRAIAVGAMGVITHLAIHSFFDNLFVQGMYLHVALWFAIVAIVAASTNTGATHPLARRETIAAPCSESDG